jgi:hypothetical protein
MSCQAARDTSSFDGLIELFEYLGNFLNRLEIYTTIPPSSQMTELVVKIMVHLLSVLALATKKIKEGRFSKRAIIYTLPAAQCATEKFTNKLLGETEITDALQKLDRLTQDEVRMAVAQTLAVVYGLVDNVKRLVEGRQCLHDGRQIFYSGCVPSESRATMDFIRQDLGVYLSLHRCYLALNGS